MVVPTMENLNTPLSNTKVYPIEGNVYRAIILFDDKSFLNILFKYGKTGIIEPCTSADKFIYSSLSKDIQNKISSLCETL